MNLSTRSPIRLRRWWEMWTLLAQRLRILWKALKNKQYAWGDLQEQIKSKYTVESDKAMFDAILPGHSVQEALNQSLNFEANSRDDDDVELF